VYAGGMRFSLVESLACGLLCSGLALTPVVLQSQDAAKSAAASTQPADTPPHYPTNEDLRHIKAIAAPQLSPDGKLVLFAVTETTADGAASHLWLAAIGSQEKARQITFSPPSDKRGERGAQWAPDGSAIYFLAKRGEKTQLFRLDMRGGEASPYELKVVPQADESKLPGAIPPSGSTTPATDKTSDKKTEEKPAEKKPDAAPEPLPINVGGYAPSPDGKWLAIWARDPETPGEKKQEDAKADAYWYDHDMHGTRLYLAALKADGSVDSVLKPVALAPEMYLAVWSPASDRLLVMTAKPNGASELGPAAAGWLVDAAAPEKPVKLDGIPATAAQSAAWRQDGGETVFAAQTPEDAPQSYSELFALAVGGAESSAGSARRLAAGFAGQLNGVSLYYAADGSLITSAGIGTRITPVRIALGGKMPPVAVDLGAAVVGRLNTNLKRTGWVWVANSGGQPLTLCFAPNLGEPCQSVAIPELSPANLRIAKPELVSWKSEEFTIEGLLYLPPAASGAKVPLIVDAHGGPMGAFVASNDRLADFLVGQGWALLRPNPRGSSNYGLKFATANKNDLGGGDYRDIMAGVDAVLAKYPLDANRMALIGYSYGGEMAGFVEGKTDRFKAIVSGAPVIDQFSEYGTEQGSLEDQWYYGKPWEHMEDAWRQSPLAGAAKAKTPFLLIQGESDTSDPLGQAQEMYRALRQEGVQAELVTYPRENHGPLSTGMYGYPSPEPWHGFDARQRIVEFIEKGFGQTDAKP
jgi:dipeptidyl aminopeptidase/acylaminoacyl peptidase